MSLIVEGGTGSPDAESYESAADLAEYLQLRGALTEHSPDQAEQALRRATTWLDARYRPSFPGRRRNGRAQALEWPRIEAWDASVPAEPIAEDEIPVEIVRACCEAAIREMASPGSLSPDITPGQTEKRTKVEGIEIEYFGGSGLVSDQRPLPAVIDDIMSSLLSIARGPALSAVAVRA